MRNSSDKRYHPSLGCEEESRAHETREAEEKQLGDHPVVQSARETFKALAAKIYEESWTATTIASEAASTWRLRCAHELAASAGCDIAAIQASAEELHAEQAAVAFAAAFSAGAAPTVPTNEETAPHRPPDPHGTPPPRPQ